MIDPKELLEVAKSLLSATPSAAWLGARIGDAHLRRAVSTAYYALFHRLANAAVEVFIGPGLHPSGAFRLIYRGFDHRRLKTVCDAIKAPVLNQSYRDQLRRTALSRELRDFAETFVSMQGERHRADYDPGATFLPFEVSTLIDAAEQAIENFDQVAIDERRDILALMLVGARG